MNFERACGIIKSVLESTTNIELDCENYDGILVKILRASNTLDENRTTNQTHIAITGNQMDMFPYLRADGYLDSETPDPDLKKYFIGQVTMHLSRNNISYLKGDMQIESESNTESIENSFIETRSSILRAARKSQTDQLQLSLLDEDGPDFIKFRKLLTEGSCLIILKRVNQLEYEAYGIKASDTTQALNELNNKFYKRPTNTIIDISKDFKLKEEVDYNHNRLKNGENILLYGVPGSGKSFTIQTNYCDDFDLMERVVFHPDYMNTDFVGQILPTVKGEGEEKEITYDFTPGPFTRILKKSINNPDKHFYLVIEEINRGNAPAIFGEIFQLLDRESDGTSSYKITNYNIASEVFGDKETPVFIPSNLSILATMNTADQNVFTLDTAFQRRWNMKMIENDVTKAKHAEIKILDTTVTWERFNTVVNDQIITSSATTLSSEDKRLGAYFVTVDVLEYISFDTHKDEIAERYNINLNDNTKLDRTIKDLNSRFGDKVIKYLWDDAFKF
ncbi:MAG: AAA domain-containing protein, partial [Firmicutes bacterium]|nr:AAA domain-containing protein [Bacillota bacterium]